ncbi:MAG TPA: thioredoxin domain-containing protein [Terriglobales bacterium]|nr:thioredoxin domain-containing protein [Terriglobales bacterium]
MKSRSRKFSILLATIFFLFARPGLAQQPSVDELSKQVEALRQDIKSMQTDLQEIKAMLQGRVHIAPPQTAVLDLGSRPARGNSGAKLTMVEFLDYQCPYCGKFSRETMPQIDKDYIQTGKLRYVVMQLPLAGIHKFAVIGSQEAECAGEQGKFWEMHDRLFANQQTIDQWKENAEALGLDVNRFKECLDTGRQTAQIRSDIAEAQKAGLTGTPAFFLAYTDEKNTTIKSVTRLVGAQPYSSFKAAIDRLLAEKQVAADQPQNRKVDPVAESHRN